MAWTDRAFASPDHRARVRMGSPFCALRALISAGRLPMMLPTGR